MSYNFDLGCYNELEFCIVNFDRELYSRCGYASINNKIIQTPALWLGHVMGGTPHPWKFLKVNTLIVNAYDILRNKTATESICKNGIHKHLEFDGTILMDSGGYLFQKEEELNVDPLSIIDLYEKSKPDLGVILDHPFNPSEADTVNKKRWEKTLINTKIMLENKGKVDLMPVVHGYDIKNLRNACNDIKNLINPTMVGIGSLVPLLFRTNGTKRFKNPINFVIDAIGTVREEFPNSLLHAFGVGSSKTMHLMYSLGVDSLDSSGWRLKAAYGIIQLPGVGDRHPLTRNNGRPFLNEKEKRILEQCECPSCKELSLNDRVCLLDENFPARAVHNAHVFINEQELMQLEIKDGNSKEFLRNRLNSGVFSKAYKYVIDKKETSSLKEWY